MDWKLLVRGPLVRAALGGSVLVAMTFLAGCDDESEPPLDQLAVSVLTCTAAETSVTAPGTTISAHLIDANGAMSGQAIAWNWTFRGAIVRPVSSRTDAVGMAKTEYQLAYHSGVQGQELVTATYVGDETHQPSQCSVALTVIDVPLPMP